MYRQVLMLCVRLFSIISKQINGLFVVDIGDNDILVKFIDSKNMCIR